MRRFQRPRLGDDQGVRVGDNAALRVDLGADELGQAEAVLVRLAVPVGKRALDALGHQLVDHLHRLLARVDLLGRGDEAPRRAEARDEGLVARHHRKDVAQRAVDGREEVQLAHLRHARLHGHGTARREPVADERVELLGEEHARRPLFQGLDEVDRDEIEPLRRLFEVGAGILVPQFGPLVLEGALVHLREMLLAEIDHFVVDVDHHRPLDRGISQHFPECGALATTDDEPGLRLGLARQHPRMDERLVVDELVSLAGLNAPVEHEGLAVGGGLHDLDVLELRLRLHDGPHDGMHMPLDGRRGLEEPLVRLRIDQLTGTVTAAGALLTMGTEGLRNIPRCTSTTEVRSALNSSTRELAATSGSSTSPQEKMSTAAYRYSGHVWMERWDSAMTTTPLTPNGLNSWKTTSTIVACARFAASTRAAFTDSRLLMASESQSNSSRSRCRPSAFNRMSLPFPIRPSTAPLLRRMLSSPLAPKNFFCRH